MLVFVYIFFIATLPLWQFYKGGVLHMESNVEFWTSARFFQRLDFLLEMKGITFNQLSFMSETSISSIYQARRRKTMPSFQTLCCLCDALGIKLWEFFDTDAERTAAMENVVSQMKNLSADSQSILAALVKQMK